MEAIMTVISGLKPRWLPVLDGLIAPKRVIAHGEKAPFLLPCLPKLNDLLHPLTSFNLSGERPLERQVTMSEKAPRRLLPVQLYLKNLPQCTDALIIKQLIFLQMGVL
jgi:hypothetical protein